MIIVTNIRNVDYTAYDEVWAIVRSLKHPEKMKHVPELSPSLKLFKQYLQLRNTGRWNSKAFQDLYVPTFLQEMQTAAARKKLNELVWLDRHERRIALILFLLQRNYMPQEHRRRHPSARWNPGSWHKGRLLSIWQEL